MPRPLDASALSVTRGYQPCPGSAQLGELGGQQVGELAVLDVCRQGRIDLFRRIASGEPCRDRRKRPAFRAQAQRPEQEGERDDGPSDGSQPVRQPADRLGNVRRRRDDAVDHAVSAASTAAKNIATTDATIVRTDDGASRA